VALAVVLLAVVGVVVATSAASTSSHPLLGRPHLSERRILSIAETAARRAGDPTPSLVQHSEGTRHDANLVASGDIVPGQRWSYLIAERGRFALNDVSVPAGARGASGSVLTLIVDASTGEITDSGLSNRYPHLATLSAVITDLRRTAFSAARASTFISLWPACACGRRAFLDVFSLRTGRRLGSLAEVQTAPSAAVKLAAAAARPGAPVLLTFSSGPLCAGPRVGGGSAGPCFPESDSCSSRIVTVDPNTRRMNTLLSIPSSRTVTDAVPSPNGRLVVLSSDSCATSYFDLHLVVRELATGRQWSIGADAPRCHEIGRPAWSPDGSRLVFAYGPSILPRGTKPAALESCSAPRDNRLAVLTSSRGSASTSWRLIRADKGCSFEAAAFDRQGIAAAEGCRQGSPAGYSDPNLGRAYLLQLNHHDRVAARVALEPGWEEGTVSSMRDGTVLVSQDQPANESNPERDWVGKFDGHQLHPIARYNANDAAQVIAVPW
jgi:WD40-like Beta Propeller Repeat